MEYSPFHMLLDSLEDLLDHLESAPSPEDVDGSLDQYHIPRLESNSEFPIEDSAHTPAAPDHGHESSSILLSPHDGPSNNSPDGPVHPSLLPLPSSSGLWPAVQRSKSSEFETTPELLPRSRIDPPQLLDDGSKASTAIIAEPTRVSSPFSYTPALLYALLPLFIILLHYIPRTFNASPPCLSFIPLPLCLPFMCCVINPSFDASFSIAISFGPPLLSPSLHVFASSHWTFSFHSVPFPSLKTDKPTAACTHIEDPEVHEVLEDVAVTTDSNESGLRIILRARSTLRRPRRPGDPFSNNHAKFEEWSNPSIVFLPHSARPFRDAIPRLRCMPRLPQTPPSIFEFGIPVFETSSPRFWRSPVDETGVPEAGVDPGPGLVVTIDPPFSRVSSSVRSREICHVPQTLPVPTPPSASPSSAASSSTRISTSVFIPPIYHWLLPCPNIAALYCNQPPPPPGELCTSKVFVYPPHLEDSDVVPSGDHHPSEPVILEIFDNQANPKTTPFATDCPPSSSLIPECRKSHVPSIEPALVLNELEAHSLSPSREVVLFSSSIPSLPPPSTAIPHGFDTAPPNAIPAASRRAPVIRGHSASLNSKDDAVGKTLKEFNKQIDVSHFLFIHTNSPPSPHFLRCSRLQVSSVRQGPRYKRDRPVWFSCFTALCPSSHLQKLSRNQGWLVFHRPEEVSCLVSAQCPNHCISPPFL